MRTSLLLPRGVFGCVQLAFFVSVFAIAQDKKISTEELYNGTFRAEGLYDLTSLKNGVEYSVLNTDQKNHVSSIDVYGYADQVKNRTVLSSSATIPFFESYEFSPDESKILLETEQKPVYRRSKTGIYYVYNVYTKISERLSEQRIQEPTFSPDGTKIAYTYDNDLYVKDLSKNKTIRVTTDGAANSVINGLTDWVYEEEFGFVRAFEWNSDSTKLAYLRFDESAVPLFSMDVYAKNLYPVPQKFKYPKPGEANSKVSIHVYDLPSSKTENIILSKNTEYIPRLKWNFDPSVLSFQTLNRSQNTLNLIFYNCKSKRTNVVLAEVDEAYVDLGQDYIPLDDNTFFWMSERSGYRHIYRYASDGRLIKQITSGKWEVTKIYGYDYLTKTLYYQSDKEGSIYRDVCAIRSDNVRRISTEKGTNDVTFSKGFKFYILQFSNSTTPPTYTVYKAQKNKKLKTLIANEKLSKTLKDYNLPLKAFSTIPINGNELNMWMIKPIDFDPSKKYPILLYQYSGPGSQSVSDSWNSSNDFWHMMLAQKGYIIACVDGRGTGHKGRDFKKVTYKNLGKYEVEDQIAAAKKLGALPYVDASRIGIWGWSFGGFMSSNCIFQGNDVFKTAIAVAPVTSWRFYDSVYTERFMQTPQENPNGYDANSPLSHIGKLKGHFLLIHGSADDNVHLQNTMQLVEALIQANKPFEWQIYPDKNHGIYGGNTRHFLYSKMTDFLLKNL